MHSKVIKLQILVIIIMMSLLAGCYDLQTINFLDKKEQKTINLSDGSLYSGEVINNIPNGQGVLTSKDGFIYTGDFKKGEFIKGSRSHKDYSDIAKGEFKNGVLHGKGEMHTQEGVSKGSFKNGFLDGDGYWESGSTGDRFVGTYKDGVLIGKAKIEFGNGDKYVGELKNDFMHGTGTLTYTNGEKYVGEFRDGQPTGNGKYFLADGEEIDFNELSVRKKLGFPINAELNRSQEICVQYFLSMKREIIIAKQLFADIEEIIKPIDENNLDISNEDYEKLVTIQNKIYAEYQIVEDVKVPFDHILKGAAKNKTLMSLEIMDTGITRVLEGFDSNLTAYFIAGKNYFSQVDVFISGQLDYDLDDTLEWDYMYVEEIIKRQDASDGTR